MDNRWFFFTKYPTVLDDSLSGDTWSCRKLLCQTCLLFCLYTHNSLTAFPTVLFPDSRSVAKHTSQHIFSAHSRHVLCQCHDNPIPSRGSERSNHDHPKTYVSVPVCTACEWWPESWPSHAACNTEKLIQDVGARFYKFPYSLRRLWRHHSLALLSFRGAVAKETSKTRAENCTELS